MAWAQRQGRSARPRSFKPGNKIKSCPSPVECSVSGALGCALRMSRAVGVAPLRFRRLRTGWRTRASFAANVYGQIHAVTFCVLVLVAYVSDFYITLQIPKSVSLRIRSTVYFLELVILTLVVLATAFTGSKRVKNMMVYLNQINKINLELSRYGRAPAGDKKRWLLLILTMIGGTFTVGLKFDLCLSLIKSEQERVLMVTLDAFFYVLYFVLYIVVLIIQMQFVLLVLAALSPLKQLNGCLSDLLREINSQAYTSHFLQKELSINNFILPTTDFTKPSRKLRRDIPGALHHLARLHGCACDVVRLVDKSHGPILLILLLSYLLHLAGSLYFIINYFLFESEPLIYSIVSQSFWGIFHIGSLISIVEPCHQAQGTMADTREIVNQMMQQVVSSDDPLSPVLEVFYRHLILNQVTYAPLKMFTVNRALVITMFTAITTNLVIVLNI